MTHKIQIILVTIISTWILAGCMSNNYYVLSTPSKPTHTYAYSNMSIGVETVTVPEYLSKRRVAVAQSASQIRLLSNATWGEDIDTGLTQRLISFLQKKFNQPSVHRYPWGLDKQPSSKVKLEISRFIALGDKVYLDATWQVKNMRTGAVKARLFSTSVATGSDAGSIVYAMDSAFSELEEIIASGVR